eukprot:g3140.t1
MFISGLGYYGVFLNKKRVGNSFLDPGHTTYGKRVLYSTYDVTQHIISRTTQQAHVIDIYLGNGWWNPLPLQFWGHLNLREHMTVGCPMVIMDLLLTRADGSSVVAASTQSDASWFATDGPMLRNDIYIGTKFDGRWKRNDRTWFTAISAPNASLVGKLYKQTVPPIRRVETLPGKKIDDGLWDCGRNFAGVARVTVAGPVSEGTHVVFRYGEILWPNGTINVLTSVAGQIKGPGVGGACAPALAEQRDELILPHLRANETYSFAPNFTWHGFRYVHVSGLSNGASVVSVEGLVMRSDVAETASFVSTSHLLTDIWKMCRDTHASNMMSIQSDCPHRERFGYTGDLLATAETALYLYDVSQFYEKRVLDVFDAQREDGGLTETAPFVGISDAGLGGESGPIGWDSVGPILQLYMYRFYGNENLLRYNYNATARWIAFLRSAPTSRIEAGLGDWMPTETSYPPLTGEAFYWWNLDAWAEINRVLHHDDEAARAASLADDAKARFNVLFLNKSTGIYGPPGQSVATQCSQAMPLYLDLVTDQDRENVVSALLQNLDVNGGAMEVGMFCVKFLLEVLTREGHTDAAYQMVAKRTDFPSYGYMLSRNATTLWESWFFSNDTFSHNHPMFSSVVVWIAKFVCGIDQTENSVAFSQLRLAPQLPSASSFGDLAVNCSFISPRGGLIESNWSQTEAGHITWSVHIPSSADATTAILPGSGTQLNLSAGVHTFNY